MEQQPIGGLLTTKEVVTLTRLSRSTLHRLRNAEFGDFPQPCRLGGKRIGWRADDIRQWIDNLPRCGVATPLENGNYRQKGSGHDCR